MKSFCYTIGSLFCILGLIHLVAKIIPYLGPWQAFGLVIALLILALGVVAALIRWELRRDEESGGNL
jgi:hypothetical protein